MFFSALLGLAVFAFASSSSDFRRTIIAIKRDSDFGDYVFLRGGSREGIPIRHNIHPRDEESFFAQTSEGDTSLEWRGYQTGQGSYRNGDVTQKPEGSPMMWTTNISTYHKTVDEDGAGYWRMNTGGSDYWMVDLDIDCAALDGEWFPFKGYLVNLDSHKSEWEGWYLRQYSCSINNTDVTIPGAYFNNHYGRCGYFNIVTWNSGDCLAQSTPIVEEIVDNIDKEFEYPIDL